MSQCKKTADFHFLELLEPELRGLIPFWDVIKNILEMKIFIVGLVA